MSEKKHAHNYIEVDMEQIMLLRDMGFTNQDICDITGLKMRTLERRLTILLQNGLIMKRNNPYC